MATNSPEPIGVHLYASNIAKDSTLSIFRRFIILNTRNLFYLQCELSALERELMKLDAQADGVHTDLEIWSIPRKWEAMRSAGLKAGDGSEEAAKYGEMWKIYKDLRSTLETYNKALQNQAWLHSLDPPAKQCRKALLDLISHDLSMIARVDAEYLDERWLEDLLTLAPKAHQSPLYQLLFQRFYRIFVSEGDIQRSDPDSPLAFFSESRISSTVRIIAIVFSSILPILSIVALYFVQSINVRLGLVVLFSALCSTLLATVSDARNAEIIASTAAYAAVQVVFVSGNLTRGEIPKCACQFRYVTPSWFLGPTSVGLHVLNAMGKKIRLLVRIRFRNLGRN